MAKYIITFIKSLKKISLILKFYPWGIPLVIILGMLSSLVEGVAITLLIPFFKYLESQQNVAINNPIFSQFNQFLLLFAPERRILVITALIFCSIFLKILLSFLYISLCKWLQFNTLHKLRFQIYQQLIKVSQSFWDLNKTGELINIIEQQTFLSSQALNYFIWLNINLSIILVFGLFLLFISWQLTLLMMLAFLLIFLISYALTRKIKVLSKQDVESSLNLSQIVLETFTGIKTVQSFGKEKYMEKLYKNTSLKHKNIKIKLGIEIMKVDPIVEGLAVSVLVGIMVINISNSFSLPILVTFVFMLYRLQPQVKQVNSNLTELMAMLNSIDQVYSLLNLTSQNYIISGNQYFTKLEKGITFDSVVFHYQGKNKPALNNISLFIPQGKTTAFVGHSGAGKSTLINLIFRFYDVTSGTIYIDNYSLPELDLSSWRRDIAIVSQDVHIFNDTVKNNIAYGCPNASDEEIILASIQAHCDEFINQLPQGYNTFIGDRGILLSGGQKQRLSIARAILCNPDILILDEATNSLDNISEKYIQESIESLSKNKTIIIIAHRLSTIENADKIIVLNKGKIEEEGSLEYLKKEGKFFPQMYKLESTQ